jgi:hypothetical protein
MREVGQIETGRVAEQAIEVLDDDGQPHTWRRIRVQLSQPTRDGEYTIYILTNLPATVEAGTIARVYRRRWTIGVSGEGHITQSVQVRPRPKDSSLVAWEAPWRESKTVKPSDPVHRGCTATHQVVTCSERRSSLVTRYSGGRDGRSRAKAAGADRNESDTAAPTGGVSAATGCEGGWVNRRSPRCPTKKTRRGGASYNREREVAAWAPGWRIGS